MRNKNLLFMLLLFISTLLYSQRVWDNPVNVYQNKLINILDMASADDGGMFVYNKSVGDSLYDLSLQKVNQNGDFLFGDGIPLFNNSYYQRIAKIDKLNDNNYIIVWEERVYELHSNLYAMKVNSSGTFLWNEPVMITTSSASISDINLKPDNDGGSFMVWTMNYSNIYCGQINNGGTITLFNSGSEISGVNDPIIHDLVIENNHLSIIFTSFSSNLLKYSKYNTIDNSLEIVNQTINYFYHITDLNFEYLKKNENQRMFAFDKTLTLTSDSCYVVSYNNNQIIHINRFTGKTLSLSAINDSEQVFVRYDDNNLYIYKLDNNGSIIAQTTLNHPLFQIDIEKFLLNKGKTMQIQNYLYIKFLASAGSISSENLLRIDLQNMMAELKTIETTEILYGYNNQISAFTSQNLFSFTIKRDRLNYSYNFSRVNLIDFNTENFALSNYYRHNSLPIGDYFSNKLYDKNSILPYHISEGLKSISASGEVSIDNSFDGINVYQYTSTQISPESHLQIYIEIPQQDTLYQADKAIINTVSNDNQVIDSLEFEPEYFPMFSHDNNFTWVSHMEMFGNDCYYLNKIDNNQFVSVNTDHQINQALRTLNQFDHFILFENFYNHYMEILKFDDDGQIIDDWGNQGILKICNLNQYSGMAFTRMFNTDQGLLIVWNNSTGFNESVTTTYYAMLINPETGEKIWNNISNLGVLKQGKPFFKNNKLYVINKTATDMLEANIFSFSDTGLNLNQTIQLSYHTVNDFDVKMLNNRFVIVSSQNFYGYSKVIMKTLGYNGTSDQFGEGFIVRESDRLQIKPQLVVLNDHSVFVNRIEYLVNSNCNTLYTDLINMDDFTETTDTFIKPLALKINANYPNPFNPSTTLSFELPKQSQVKLDIYNIKGQLVKSIFKGQLDSGKHSFEWNGKDKNNKSVSSGLYFSKYVINNISYMKKMTLIK